MSESKIPPIPCSIMKKAVDALVQDTQKAVLKWSQKMSDLRSQYAWLLYFSISRMLHLYDLIQTKKDEEILQEVSFLADSQPKAREKLKEGVNVCYHVYIESSVLEVISDFFSAGDYKDYLC